MPMDTSFRFDVVIPAAPGAAGQLARCIDALAGAGHPLGALWVTVVGANGDNELAAAFDPLAKTHTGFAALELLLATQSRGEGQLCNIGAAAQKGEWLLFLPAGVAVAPGFFAALAAAAAGRPGAAFGYRLLPNDTAVAYHPATLETPLFDHPAILLRREDFLTFGSFDSQLPARWAAVDLSRRLRGAGHPLYFVPKAVAVAAGAPPEDADAKYLEDATAKLMLAYRYGGLWRGNAEYFKAIRRPRPFPGVRKALLGRWVDHLAALWPYLFWRGRHRANFKNAPPSFWEDTAFSRGTAPLAAPVTQGPKVSLVVRTHKRPDALRLALQSAANQTYPHFEVVVVEDGQPLSQKMVETEFAGLSLRYLATGEPVGRSRAGNLGLEAAAGEYLCFLDDDDLLYPEHLELLVAQALSHPGADMILGTAMVRFMAGDACVGQQLMHFDRVDAFTMSQMCQIPIESVLFKKSLYQRRGGLDEKLEAHEDWAMWLRFLGVARRIHQSTVDVHRASCIFVQTADETQAAKRLEEYQKNDDALFSSPDIRFDVSLADMRRFHQGMLADMRHLRRLGKLDACLDQPPPDETGPDTL